MSSEGELKARIKEKRDEANALLDRAKELFEEAAKMERELCDPNRIIEAVCAAWRVKEEQLLSKSRKARVARARQVAGYLLRQHTALSFPAIGRILGRDHSTIIHSCELIAREMATTPRFAAAVNGLIA